MPRISFYYCLICRRKIKLGMNFTIPPSTYPSPCTSPHPDLFTIPFCTPRPPSFCLISPLPLEFKESGMFYCLAWDPEHGSTNFFFTFLHEKASSSNVSQIPIIMCIFLSFCTSICKVHLLKTPSEHYFHKHSKHRYLCFFLHVKKSFYGAFEFTHKKF